MFSKNAVKRLAAGILCVSTMIAPALAVAGTTNTGASKLNMRSGAGTGYNVKRSLSYGTVVTVNSINGNWAHITVKGVSGHVSLNYLQF